jgi:hypothetical protein
MPREEVCDYEDGTADTLFYLAWGRRTDRSESGAYRPSSREIHDSATMNLRAVCFQIAANVRLV